MHLVGTRIWVETQRGVARTPVLDPVSRKHQLGVNTAYDFGMQTYIPVNATLQPGDVLVSRCIYRNTPAYGALVGNAAAAAGRAVNGGEATADEMCMMFGLLAPWPSSLSNIDLSSGAPFCDSSNATAGLPSCDAFAAGT